MKTLKTLRSVPYVKQDKARVQKQQKQTEPQTHKREHNRHLNNMLNSTSYAAAGSEVEDNILLKFLLNSQQKI